MKKVKKIILMSACTLAILGLAACGKTQKQANGGQEIPTVGQTSSEKVSKKLRIYWLLTWIKTVSIALSI